MCTSAPVTATGSSRGSSAFPCGSSAVRLRLSPGVALSERVEADTAPRTTGVPAPPRPPGLHRHRVHLPRRVPAELALQVRAWPARGSSAKRTARRPRPAAPGRRGRLRRDDPLHPGLVRAVPDAAAPPRRPIRPWPPCSALWIVPLLGRGPALQPGRVLLRRPGRNDEPPHQPVPLRAGHPRLGSVRDRRSTRCG